jgi:hypothetical protein
MTDRAEAYIRCLPIAEVSRPHITALERRRCAVCDVEVWLDSALTAEVEARHPDSDIVIHCRSCPVPMNAGEEVRVEFSTGQVRRLRNEGATDEEIAELLALATIAGPSGDFNAIRLRVAVMPLSSEARAFRQALAEARIYVALTT